MIIVLLTVTVWPTFTPPAAATGWGFSGLLEMSDAGHALQPDVAFDGQGNAIAVWMMSNGSAYHIWAARYSDGAGWANPVRIQTNVSETAGWPQVAMDEDGNAVVVWRQVYQFRYQIFANNYAAGSGWGTAVRLDSFVDWDMSDPQVAMGPNGTAVSSWIEYDGLRFGLRTCRFAPAVGWGPGEDVQTNSTDGVASNHLAVDSGGNSLFVYAEFNNSVYRNWARWRLAGAGWSLPQRIDSSTSQGSGELSVGVDASGNALAVWWQYDGNWFNYWASRYAAGVGWSAATIIGTNSVDLVGPPALAVNPSGIGVAVWHQFAEALHKLW